MVTVIFLIFGSGDVQSWNDVDDTEVNKKECIVLKVKKNSTNVNIVDN